MEVIQSIKIHLPVNTSIEKDINSKIVYKFNGQRLSTIVQYHKFLINEGRESYIGGLNFLKGVNVGDYMFVTTREANRLSNKHEGGGIRMFIKITDITIFNKLKRYLDMEYEQDLEENSLPIIVLESQSVHNINTTQSNSKISQENYKKENRLEDINTKYEQSQNEQRILTKKVKELVKKVKKRTRKLADYSDKEFIDRCDNYRHRTSGKLNFTKIAEEEFGVHADTVKNEIIKRKLSWIIDDSEKYVDNEERYEECKVCGKSKIVNKKCSHPHP